MGLYADSLSRYYSGDGRLPTVRLAEELGVPFSIIGSHPTQEAPTFPAADPRVAAWRERLLREQGWRFPDGLT